MSILKYQKKMGQANSRSEELWQLSGYGNKAKVKELLAEGIADVNWISLDDNSTALMVAAGSKRGRRRAQYCCFFLL